MKAVQLTALGRMELRDVSEPAIQHPDDVLIAVGTVGVCGSDVHYHRTGRIGSQVVEYPFSVGHEMAGIVREIGSAVTRVKPGDRVAVDPATPCGKCDQCLGNREHTCRALGFLGCPGQAPGCLCEAIVMPEKCCFPISPETTLEQAALVEPLSIGVYSVKQSIPMPGARIGILGLGPIGLSVLLPALARGADRVYVTDKIDHRLRLANDSGATWTGNPDKEDIVAAIEEREPLLLDAVFECCGEQDAIDQSIEILKPGGKLVLIGIPTVDRISFSIDKLRRKEICIQNIRRQNGCVQDALDMIENREIDVSRYVTHRFGLEETGRAFDLVADYRDGVMKAMIHLVE